MKLKLIKILTGTAIVFGILMITSSSVFSQRGDSSDNKNGYTNSNGKSLQTSKTLEAADRKLDSKINEFNKLLAAYSSMKGTKVRITPANTKFIEKENYIELENYDFILENLGSSNVVGSRIRRIRLFFNGNDLEKVESEVIDNNFLNKSKEHTKVIDPSPNTVENGDIVITHQKNTEPKVTKELKDFDNTLSQPNKIKFKREWYLEHLIDFERMFRYTKKYQQMYGSNTDYDTIEILKKSLNY